MLLHAKYWHFAVSAQVRGIKQYAAMRRKCDKDAKARIVRKHARC